MNRAAPLTRRHLLGLLAAAGVGLSGCSAPRPAHVLGASEERGFYYEFAHLLSRAVERSGAAFSITPRTTDGSLDNMELLGEGAVDLALVLADVALESELDLRAMGRMYLSYVQLAVPGDSEVRTISDLRGRTVMLGREGSGTSHVGHRVLRAGGMDLDDVELVDIPLTRLRRALDEGAVDAALFAGGVPNPQMEAGAAPGTGSGIRLVDLSRELGVLQERYGKVYQAAAVPRGIYGATREVPSIGVATLLVSRSGLPEEVARGVVEVLVRRSAELVPSGTVGVQYLDPRSLIYTFGIPLHPGAAAAYRDLHG
ncbi:TAXI family TRAP transporter solute-binding subunit [Kocuria sp. M1R5S2]|uniref:TAXI family TRAP transporter solute-binding subunit n=1 Tax=Kocuria rhizosphaerae TaxID=3376285 RepID=UPI0037A0D234